MFQSNLPANSKTWVYQSNREFTTEEQTQIQQQLDRFLKNMDSHGHAVTSESTILYDRFLVIIMDNTQMALCGSVGDRLLQFIQGLEREFDLSLLDRMQVAYRNGDSVKSISLKAFQDLLKQGKINENTTVFNNLVTTNKGLEKEWEVPVKKSWHKRYLKAKV